MEHEDRDILIIGSEQVHLFLRLAIIRYNSPILMRNKKDVHMSIFVVRADVVLFEVLVVHELFD